MNHADISIIIVNWKSRDYVEQCIKSIFQYDSNLILQVIVVDNASYDGCGEMLAAKFPQITFIQSAQNLGFAKANNLAFAQSNGRNILFLNPDTKIQRGALERLLSALQSLPRAGMVGARILNSDLSLQTTCVTAAPTILNQILNFKLLRRMFPKWEIWGMRALFEKKQIPARVEAISGACMLSRRDVMEHVGIFSTDYFMYAEDMDLCVKVAQADWKIYYVPDAAIIHYAGGSSSSRENNFSNIVLRESLVRFFRKHRGVSYARLYRLSLIITSIARILMLAVLLPVIVFKKGRIFLFPAMSKWLSILMWCLSRGHKDVKKRGLQASRAMF